jgi:pyruvate/2-oxoglutarate/acetoin dehydrogenase E1 component
VENAHRLCSVASEIAATVAEEAFGSLRRPAQRLTAPDVHVPFSPTLEKQLFPDADRIVAAIKKIV